ncbi:hypothetical protein CXG81DRAFT_28666 [Caulochytrium protostelioides]|uniref:Uncharacterized protein n=1 Tax=Caulochytrium protostelioides TaxID=1555241 RepID=A0A4P9X0S9_9FUNG|nr:hypothetical protein CXG81DRAFT_28666 [Caulochytrium protostelioides]|eukprot:RKO98515.1 hypothetical protein CXG81DRAFT_28666 [Caulochytrium protostelioides]
MVYPGSSSGSSSTRRPLPVDPVAAPSHPATLPPIACTRHHVPDDLLPDALARWSERMGFTGAAAFAARQASQALLAAPAARPYPPPPAAYGHAPAAPAAAAATGLLDGYAHVMDHVAPVWCAPPLAGLSRHLVERVVPAAVAARIRQQLAQHAAGTAHAHRPALAAWAAEAAATSAVTADDGAADGAAAPLAWPERHRRERHAQAQHALAERRARLAARTAALRTAQGLAARRRRAAQSATEQSLLVSAVLAAQREQTRVAANYGRALAALTPMPAAAADDALAARLATMEAFLWDTLARGDADADRGPAAAALRADLARFLRHRARHDVILPLRVLAERSRPAAEAVCARVRGRPEGGSGGGGGGGGGGTSDGDDDGGDATRKALTAPRIPRSGHGNRFAATIQAHVAHATQTHLALHDAWTALGRGAADASALAGIATLLDTAVPRAPARQRRQACGHAAALRDKAAALRRDLDVAADVGAASARLREGLDRRCRAVADYHRARLLVLLDSVERRVAALTPQTHAWTHTLCGADAAAGDRSQPPRLPPSAADDFVLAFDQHVGWAGDLRRALTIPMHPATYAARSNHGDGDGDDSGEADVATTPTEPVTLLAVPAVLGRYAPARAAATDAAVDVDADAEQAARHRDAAAALEETAAHHVAHVAGAYTASVTPQLSHAESTALATLDAVDLQLQHQARLRACQAVRDPADPASPLHAYYRARVAARRHDPAGSASEPGMTSF